MIDSRVSPPVMVSSPWSRTTGTPQDLAIQGRGDVHSRRRKSKRRARRILIWLAATLCLSPIFGGWLVDHCPLRFRYPEGAELLERWRSSAPTPNLILLGSSRLRACIINDRLTATTTGLFGQDAPRIFNGSIGGGEPLRIEMLTNRMFTNRNLPKLAVIEASPDLLRRRNLYFISDLTIQMTTADLPRYAGDLIRYGGISRLLSSRLTPFYRHRTELLDWVNETVRRHVGLGNSAGANPEVSKPAPKPARPPTPVADVLALYAKGLEHYEIGGATAAAFERVIARFRSVGCEVVLFEPPLTSGHRALFPDRIRAVYRAYIEQLERNYGIHFIDYSERFPDDYFYDTHHVNDQGRVTSTDLFAQEVIAPVWREIVANRSATEPANGDDEIPQRGSSEIRP